MTELHIDFNEHELTLIYRLCEQATVNGYDTAKTLVSLMDKIRAIAQPPTLPEGQERLPVQNLE
ncbi:MAG: hypothetical protein CML45_00945 [Rhodobacteraceae bacterium]|jgi:hypothetical protein|nr:hypothetical protein [Paracoccaceae bacterium]|tara:strand:+ start:15 stop:206 length:192 start_codon:yes stop_codon:yes gene_type:complete